MYTLVPTLIRFLDEQKLTQEQLQDIEYLADKVSVWADYWSAQVTYEQCIELSKKYLAYRSKRG